MIDPQEDELEFLKARESFEMRRRRPRQAKSSAQLLSQLIARQGFSQTQWHDDLNQAWQTVVGKPLAGKTKPTMMKRGTLEVLVNSSAAMQQMAFMKQGLLKKIQQKLPQANIQSLRFRVGKMD